MTCSTKTTSETRDSYRDAYLVHSGLIFPAYDFLGIANGFFSTIFPITQTNVSTQLSGAPDDGNVLVFAGELSDDALFPFTNAERVQHIYTTGRPAEFQT